MKRSIFALSWLAGFAVAAEGPNIVLIVTDDQSWDSLSFMGGKVHTRRIDLECWRG